MTVPSTASSPGFLHALRTEQFSHQSTNRSDKHHQCPDTQYANHGVVPDFRLCDIVLFDGVIVSVMVLKLTSLAAITRVNITAIMRTITDDAPFHLINSVRAMMPTASNSTPPMARRQRQPLRPTFSASDLYPPKSPRNWSSFPHLFEQ